VLILRVFLYHTIIFVQDLDLKIETLDQCGPTTGP